jgi:CarboxypepD_reg-like domain
MKTLPLFVIFLFLSLQFYGQTITGKVLDASTEEPLIYASIGMINTPFGTITDEKGNYNLEIKGLLSNSLVRFSMIGFKSHIYTIEELLNKENAIRLEIETINLPEVIVKSAGKLKKVGTRGYSSKHIIAWRGNDFSKGYEFGTKIELGNSPVKLKSLHMHVYTQTYDSILVRLHIRNIVENLPHDELLNTDILILITKESGWIDIDLSKYNLVFKDDIALSIEWIKVMGGDINKRNTITGQLTQVVAFNVNPKKGLTFNKRGTEAKWDRRESGSPCFYLTIQ